MTLFDCINNIAILILFLDIKLKNGLCHGFVQKIAKVSPTTEIILVTGLTIEKAMMEFVSKTVPYKIITKDFGFEKELCRQIDNGIIFARDRRGKIPGKYYHFPLGEFRSDIAKAIA
ncbi:MAG: hypothetical protein A2268_05105 [Candidatus Raymondbacteria bacterium RifOxyA12_full_50_37]|uniref:Uncharacterized protein n=1 Tax=Candidatus Raymondbacteria bacterium RIFOXYD12_FULL_49_13 TaxID=1817890 RepID=A0A1F7FDK4_UNCRA|nr:MAG: hypothetical protein A2248_10155 [Candidatus Raymondbacteria bacterium RIFOXYA2_FULL_49_16]OGJ88144.1 MAG: hypothetical protein A2268_05105 [Candidatus Raymondbacteria bacterium RifOxyA12_full_50_37]OGJ93645.1 MAG: hypothetical protein A2350_06650 [Candidatus Raymondbacteria bacterium RifOxyB12_full_50_8]OGJ96946.1 MAG: hypothetical protein A2453_04910 [Candidatus Raymondbacteria bacterium RIFOXYC2_FULL_50_21]OGK04671.1 MAG: hypothetical protein A2519_21080 [Candidatus Raymondbacteria b